MSAIELERVEATSAAPLAALVAERALQAVVVVGAGAAPLASSLAALGLPTTTIEPRREGTAMLAAAMPGRSLQGEPRRVLADLRHQLPEPALYVFADCGLPADSVRSAIFQVPRGSGAIAIVLDPAGELRGLADVQDQLLRWSPDHHVQHCAMDDGTVLLVAVPRPAVHVTFLIERYTHAYGTSGISINLDNLVGTLSATGLATSNVVHYDQCHHEGRPLPLDELSPPPGCGVHVVVFTLHYHSRANPSPAFLEQLRARGSRVVVMWLDKRISTRSDDYYRAADVNVVLDGNDFELPNSWPAFTPKNPRWFHDPGLVRDIDVSLVGEVRYLPQRKAMVDRLRAESRVQVTMCGTSAADSGRALPMAEYARLYQRSRISLAMTKDSARQLKGRVFEIVHCGALLFCDVNHHVQHHFTPGRDYVEYRDYEDLVAKLQHYVAHEDERAAIAAAGHRRATTYYNHDVFWRSLLARCGASAAIWRGTGA